MLAVQRMKKNAKFLKGSMSLSIDLRQARVLAHVRVRRFRENFLTF